MGLVGTFFVSAGLMLLAGILLLGALLQWHGAEEGTAWEPHPVRVAVLAGCGVLSLGASLWVLAL
ncbi:hypothetical protein [Streptomyces sp. NPDC088785]|uniref:hypothetical protein n=1 Tax=Streptomyces sp. NPDC088785 TaxID=3365897 RepID=UPI0038290A2E